MSTDGVDKSKRRFLTLTTSAVGAVGVVGAAIPFVMSMTPSAQARAAGAPVEVDISKLEPGQLLTVEWRGKPVWVLKRTPEMLESLKKDVDMISDPKSEKSVQPAYVNKETRSIKPDILVLVGICTHLGCSPLPKLEAGVASGMPKDWPGGFFCPCHGSKFDLAGRVFKDVPAPVNLVVPPYTFEKENIIKVGVDSKEGVA
jgi:ubiquinol-cytochrome c reductase iron-sulfur subunit